MHTVGCKNLIFFLGRDAAPMFLRRGKLPKNVEALKQPGKVTDRTVLNVFGPTGHGGRYILDSLKVKTLVFFNIVISELLISIVSTCIVADDTVHINLFYVLFSYLFGLRFFVHFSCVYE